MVVCASQQLEAVSDPDVPGGGGWMLRVMTVVLLWQQSGVDLCGCVCALTKERRLTCEASNVLPGDSEAALRLSSHGCGCRTCCHSKPCLAVDLRGCIAPDPQAQLLDMDLRPIRQRGVCALFVID
jgi:hypothetical protein